MLSPYHIPLLVRYFNGIDIAVSKRLLRSVPPSEPTLTEEFCALMDVDNQRRESSLEFDIDSLNAALCEHGDLIDADFRIETHQHTGRMEAYVSQSDFALVIDFEHTVLPDLSWGTAYLMQAKRLFPLKDDTYGVTSAFASADKEQHLRMQALSDILGDDAMKYCLYCPPTYGYERLCSRIVLMCYNLTATDEDNGMERKEFLAWSSQVDRLSEAQKLEPGEVLAGRPVGEASVAAVEMGVGEDRTCPRCGAHGAVANGKTRGVQRYLCQSCNRTFGAMTGRSMNGLHHKDLWLTYSECLANGDTIRTAAKQCGRAISTSFRWRHRFLAGINTGTDKLKGIVEADETWFLESRKGDRVWTRAAKGKPSAERPVRKARKRGGKATKRGLSDEQVPVLVAADRSGTTFSTVLPKVNANTLQKALAPVIDKDALLVTDGNNSYPLCATALGVSHEALNQSSGERVRGELHIQNVNNRHSRLKKFIEKRYGVATKYLANYLRWYHLIVLEKHSTPRFCLARAMG